MMENNVKNIFRILWKFYAQMYKNNQERLYFKKKINIPNLTSFLSIPIPNAIVATTTLISDVVHFVSTSDLSEFFIPAWYALKIEENEKKEQLKEM